MISFIDNPKPPSLGSSWLSITNASLSLADAVEVTCLRPVGRNLQPIASHLLVAVGDNSCPSAKDIKKILDSVDIEVDDDRLNKVISELNGKNMEDVIAQSVGKLASVPAGGTLAVSADPGSAAPTAGSALAAAEEKKERSLRSWMMTWDSACLIKFLPPCK
jgi:large subunit ribosomal protein LP2